MKPNIEELRKKYIDNPPEGMTSKDIRNMSGDELLDMDYFFMKRAPAVSGRCPQFTASDDCSVCSSDRLFFYPQVLPISAVIASPVIM